MAKKPDEPKKPEDMTAKEIIAAQNARTAAPVEEVGSVVAAEVPADDIPVDDTPKPPDPWEVLARLTSAIEAIAGRSQQGESTDGKALEILTTAVMRLADASITGSKIVAESQIKAMRPSNEVVPEISVFNRRGRDPKAEGMDPKLHLATIKPPLKCDMFFPWVLEWESLTREEVQLLNLLEEGAYTVKLADRSKVTMTVDIKWNEANTKPSKLFVNHETAFNQANYRNVPPLTEILRQMLKQHDPDVRARSAAVLMDEEEEALIEVGQITVTQ